MTPLPPASTQVELAKSRASRRGKDGYGEKSPCNLIPLFHIVFLPQTTILTIFAGLLKISAEIPFYGIDELYARRVLEYSTFLLEPFYCDKLCLFL